MCIIIELPNCVAPNQNRHHFARVRKNRWKRTDRRKRVSSSLPAFIHNTRIRPAAVRHYHCARAERALDLVLLYSFKLKRPSARWPHCAFRLSEPQIRLNVSLARTEPRYVSFFCVFVRTAFRTMPFCMGVCVCVFGAL